MLTITSAVAGATLIGLGAAGSTLAMWNDSDAFDAPIVLSGSMDITVEGVDSFALAGNWTRMLPGDRITHQVDVATSGSVASTVAVATAASSNFVVRVQRGVCPSAPLPPTPASLGMWAANESIPVCIEVTLAPTASQSAAENLNVTFVATQKAS
jgi:predicted ribosomally synthesized peptide with SipW-like signal peptide